MRQLISRTFQWLLALACCLASGACEKRKPAARQSGAASLFVVDVVPVQPQALRETLAATGSLVARESVQLQSERAGVVREISFEEGKLVKAGEVLVSIDASELQAQLARAKAQLDLAAKMEARQQTLMQSRGISAAEFDESKAAHNVAKAEVKLIEAQIAKTKIEAPFDGIAGIRQVSVGAYLTPGTVICSFQDISALKIDFSLPERYLGYIKAGQRIAFRVTGRSERFEATIAAIEPTVDVQTRSLLIRATVPNEDTRLLPGSFAEVEVLLEEIPDAILIPSIALMPGLQQQTVFVHQDGKVQQRKVQAGLRTADAVQIVEGLAPGEELITSGILQLRDGMRVQVKRAAAKPEGAPKKPTPAVPATTGPPAAVIP